MTLTSDVLRRLEDQEIEVPSWAFGNSGTRFKVFAQPGVPRDPFEKVADAAQVHAMTGLAPSVALHIPWDDVDDFAKLGEHAASLGMRLGTINSNTFQDDIYKLGSLAHPDAAVRQQRDRPSLPVHRDHARDRIGRPEDLARRRHQLSRPGRHPWSAGATRRGAGDDLRTARRDQRLVLEYKFFEPAFYHTDVPDWGTSYVHCACARRAGGGVPRHGSPRAGDQHRVHRRPTPAVGQARFVRLQLAVLRRRRPDRRCRRSVPAVPNPARGESRRRLRGELRCGVHARPVPQHRAQDPRPDPERAERAGDDSPRPARSTPTRSQSPSATATCWAPIRS